MSSKIECTAVNELIDLVQKKPMDRDSAAELLFADPGGRKRPASGTPAPAPVARGKRDLDPGARHAAAAARAAQPRVKQAVEAPTEALATRQATPAAAAGRTRDELETTYLPRAAELPSLLKKLAIPATLLLVVGLGVGAVISITRSKDEDKPLEHATAVAAPKVLPTVVVAPKLAAPISIAKPALVAVRIESTPAGASATLLDRDTGNSMPIGTTPLEASLDPAKSYDVRFELDGRATQTEHLAIAANDANPRLAIAFAEPAPAPAPPTKKHHRHHDTGKKVAAKRVATASRTKAPSGGEAALASLGPAKDKKSDAPGAIAVSASVPCAILLDGVNTGMTTPAKLTVAAGHHSVRLIAATQHINKQFGVDVTAKKTANLSGTF